MVYVCTTNMVSLTVAYVLSFNKMKKILGIPVISEVEALQIKEATKKKSSTDFISQWKDSRQNQKIVSEVTERDALREKEFKNAGTRPPIRTFKTNPKADTPPKSK